jgi:iron complex outermembrane receptor protein
VNGTPDNREFDDEDTTSYELGVKSTLLDARLRINASAFYSEIDDFQSQRQLETGVVRLYPMRRRWKSRAWTSR